MRCDAQYDQSLNSEVDYLGGVTAVRGEFAGVRRLQSGPILCSYSASREMGDVAAQHRVVDE